MKIAILIQGSPRFCEEFDIFLDNLKNLEHEYHWYFYLWNCNPAPDTHGYNLIAPNWRNFTDDWAISRIEQHLPANHKIIKFQSADHQELQFPSVGNRAGETNAEHVWKMFYSLYQVNELRKSSGIDYDMIIKGRPDVSVKNLDIDAAHRNIESNPNQVLISRNHHHGYVGKRLNDWAAVFPDKVCDIYCGLYNKIQEYNSTGLMFHPESMLSHHLSKNNIEVTYYTFEVGLRHTGTMTGHVYNSNFSRWAQ